ncbi:sensor histidine kinase [Chryseobacterium cucumeris]|uniref:sensor histidine kinase n=2 Tax=Chryseobacterium group TaxID=2782232 RepID=UPI00192D8A9B|nr:histidine kinase [Chryseobacterium cucumeris]QRA44346.1 histidine kinase [Chryseobacterium cucumeris]
MIKNEGKIYFYSSLLITLVVNSAKLMALNTNGIIARYWHFNIWEYSFQFLYNFVFCLLLFYFNLSRNRFFGIFRENKQWIRFYLANTFLIAVFFIAGSTIHYIFFGTVHLPGTMIRGYFARFLLSTIMIAVVIRLILLMRESRNKDQINEQLQTAYLQAQLRQLQEQLNPHFLFNTLSSLSAIVRENPQQAQSYIVHLSKVFRYTLVHTGNDLVTINQELLHLSSYTQLLSMRLENSFQINIAISQETLQREIPHLSLQPLVENAVKHNIATISQPLCIDIYNENNSLVVRNNLQPLPHETEGTGLGLINLGERYKLQIQHEIEIHTTKEYFIVKLPLL